jgi:hypothetical protein
MGGRVKRILTFNELDDDHQLHATVRRMDWTALPAIDQV